MEPLLNLEHKLARLLGEHVPMRLPVRARKGLGKALWVLALVFGVMMFWSMLDRLALRMLDYGFAGGAAPGEFGFFYYLSLVLLAMAAALLLVSAPALKAGERKGWRLVFYGLLANVGYGVVSLFTGIGGLAIMLWALAVSVAAAYFLFQVRSQFK